MQYMEHKEHFLQHINNMANVFKFTVENTRENGSKPILDILVTPEHNGTLTSSFCRKPAHTEEYMHWDSYHNIEAKYRVITLLTHRAKTVSFTPELFRTEIQHIREVLTKCKFPSWAIDRRECQKHSTK